MNEAQALLMCIPATAVAITLLIWLRTIHDRLVDRASMRAVQKAREQQLETMRLRMQRRPNGSQEAALPGECITTQELRAMLGGDGAGLPCVRFDGEGGFSALN